MRACILLGVLALSFVPLAAQCETRTLSPEKAEMMGRVEDFFLHNFRDITWRKSLEWGEVESLDDGARTIRYTYEAKIWDKEHLVMSQEFTFAEDGECLRYENVTGFPQKKLQKKVDVSTREGMIDLVEDFFSKNFRDVTARKTLKWGELSKDEQGNTSIAYEYEATIWDKDKKLMHQIFTFDPRGEFVAVKDAKMGEAKNRRP
jgi:hypothetical protein